MIEEIKKSRAENKRNQAADELNQDKLDEAQVFYQQALEILDTPELREQIWCDLTAYFEDCLAKQWWSRADSALTIAQNLGVADDETLTILKTELYGRQAEAELQAERLDAAFDCLKRLDDKVQAKVAKNLTKIYVQDKFRQSKWFKGDAVLKYLIGLLPNDHEALSWRANWLFMWAEPLFPQDKATQKPARAKRLCQKILEITPENVQVNDFLTDTATSEKDTLDLRHQTYTLLGNILLAQIHTCLTLPDFADEAERFFQAALALRVRPERQSLFKLALDRAQLSLQADRPDQAFVFLHLFKTDLKDKHNTDLNDSERDDVKKLIYRFNRLYAGRDCWGAAKQALSGLREWLSPPDKQIGQFLDELNYEWLAFVKAKRFQKVMSVAEVKRQELEVKVAEAGYRDFKILKINTQIDWTNALFEASLTLGQTYLANNNLSEAIKSYRKVLDTQGHEQHEAQISQSLHSYSEHLLNQGYRDKAQLALNELKKFNLAAPDGQIRPDLRVDGAIQKAILAKARACLIANQVKEAFDQLQTLDELQTPPLPWPVGQVKEMVRVYSQACYDRSNWAEKNSWTYGISALEGLNEFLSSDQQALEWLIDDLEQWGRRLKKQGDLAKAAELYEKAIVLSGQAVRCRASELADFYIRQIALELAQGCLDDDLKADETSTAVEEAVAWHRKILTLPEHHNEHEALVNDAIHRHALNLSKIDEWLRAHQTLDKLDELHPSEAKYKTLFAHWRRELILAEIEMRLGKLDLDQAFERLSWLKNWLDNYEAPKASWLDQANAVREIYHPFYQTWLDKKEWALAVQASEQLGSLLPEDNEVRNEIRGWEIRALVAWGQAEHKQSHWEKALEFYDRALARTLEHEVKLKIDIQSHALETRLAKAQQLLDKNKPDKAKDVYAEALKQPREHPNRADRIRKALKAFSDHLIEQQTPPDWKTAHQALDYLEELGLDNPEWRHDLVLQEVDIILNKQDDIDTAFDKLATMPLPRPLDRIQDVVEAYSESRAAKVDTCEKAIKALNRLKSILDENISARQRLREHAKKLGDRLLKQIDTYSCAEEAYKLEYELSSSR